MTKILIVEDEKILSEMYVERFIQEGFEVVHADSAEKGYELARAEKPDLVILDILLLGDTGIDFLKTLRKDPVISQTPVIAFSNYDDVPTKKEAFALGVRDYLIKTAYTPQGIVDKIKEFLSQ
jgi:two-component system, OmpR family, alkaline phosphatase synthesis response regulator PhoP